MRTLHGQGAGLLITVDNGIAGEGSASRQDFTMDSRHRPPPVQGRCPRRWR
ncbi:MAG: hypothetical protein ACLUUJ_03255 [Acutalibacteraceae bacterium]